MHWLAGQGEVLRDADGNPARMAGAVLDITRRKSAEDALRKREEDLRRSEAYLAEGQRLSHTGSWAWNVSTGELFWSQEHFHICGLDSAKTKPPYPKALEWVHPEDRSLVQQTFARAIRERSDFELDYRIVRPDGMIRYIRSLAQPVFNEAGDLTEYVGSIIDTTDRNQAELQLSELSGRLLKAQDEERRRLARELHDSTAQTLTGLSLRLAVVEGEAASLSVDARRALKDSAEMLGQASREIRSLSYLLHPPFLDGQDWLLRSCMSLLRLTI